jgi:glycosyltransferase involved in cell wall biosynthesis
MSVRAPSTAMFLDPFRMRVLQTIAGLDEEQGGPSYSVPRLCKALTRVGVETSLLSVAASGQCGGTWEQDGYLHKQFRWNYSTIPVFQGLRHSEGLSRALRTAGDRTDVIHNHGIWLLPNIYAGHAASAAEKPLMVSPRGMLSPVALSFSRYKKKVFWKLLQESVIRGAACLHATSEQEYEEIRAFGLSNPVAIIPNGVDIPDLIADEELPRKAHRVALSLGRLHPKKGLDRLLNSWAKVEPSNGNWRLRIIGPSEDGYDKRLRELVQSLGLTRVSIEGPVYGEEKWKAYRAADLFILSTLNENFGLTVAEALAAGTPVISTKGAPWSALEAEGCGWWVDHGVELLAAALSKAMALPEGNLKAKGAAGRAWMKRDYSWERVAQDMADVYSWLCHGGAAPMTMRMQ